MYELFIYGTKVNEDFLIESKFIHSEGDNNWWIRSGTTQLIESTETTTDAQNRFYLPLSYTDPFGSVTKIKYGGYFLFINETEDALGNVSKVENLDPAKPGFNFRTLSPQWMKDINGNFSEAITDELGLVKAMAVFGKGNEADDLPELTEFTEQAESDLIQEFFNLPHTAAGIADSTALHQRAKQLLNNTTARFVYDFDVYKNTGKPAVVASIVREKHFQQNIDAVVQVGFEYSNGLGQAVMKKVQAEPDKAKKATVNEIDNTVTITDVDTDTQLR